jgi:DNA-binding Xre family transcriptional regulator
MIPLDSTSPLVRVLSEQRNFLQISWRKLAQEIGVDEFTLQRLRSEKTETTLMTLRKIAEFFHLEPDDVGQIALYEPRCVREKRLRKEGKKNEPAKKGSSAAEPSGDGPPEP